MKMIVAADRNWGIGNNGDLLMYNPKDMDFFKSQTMGHVIVMGRKTFESFPGKKALPGRTNLVLTGNPDWRGEGAQTAHSKEELDELLKSYESDQIYIIGGGQLYRMYVNECDTIYVTHIEAEFEADTWFPDLDKNGQFEKKKIILNDTYNNVGFQICEWTKK